MLSISRPEAYLTRMLGREITQQEMADLLGITRQTYSNRCRTGMLTSADFIAISRHFGVNPVGLLNWCGIVDIADLRDFIDQIEGRVVGNAGRATDAALDLPAPAAMPDENVSRRQRRIIIGSTRADQSYGRR